MNKKNKKKNPLPPLGRGIEVKVKGRRGWHTLRSVSINPNTPNAWWAINPKGQVVPVREADITSAREKGK